MTVVVILECNITVQKEDQILVQHNSKCVCECMLRDDWHVEQLLKVKISSEWSVGGTI